MDTEEKLFSNGAVQENSQIMILMKGHPGCGKSRLGSELSRQLRWPLIDKDDAKDCFIQYETRINSVDWNTLSYQVMWHTTETQIKLGLSVVVDCPLARRSLFDTALEISNKYDVRVIVLNCECRNEDIWKSRLQKRRLESTDLDQTHKPQTWEQVQQLLQRYDGCWKWTEEIDWNNPDCNYRLIQVDTAEPLNQYISGLIQDIQQMDRKKTIVASQI